MWVRIYLYWDQTRITMKTSENGMHKGKTQADDLVTPGWGREYELPVVI